jgi:hypothetical protein
MASLYVCQFTNGVIKVGRANDPVVRIAQHAARASCFGVRVSDSEASECVGDPVAAEAQLISLCRAAASAQHCHEWFEGLNFCSASEWMQLAAATHYERPTPSVPASVASAHTLRFADRRYVCQWAGREHFWIDMRPQEAHWPDSDVMRWDLFQSKWHLIWPELIDHPCAVLFAPKHPLRSGPPVFADWVGSWGGVANKAELLVSMPPRAIEIAKAIWPELLEAKAAAAEKQVA